MIVLVQPGKVRSFVNFGLRLHDPYHQDLTDCFWRQFDFIRPYSYPADCNTCLTFVTRNAELFDAACEKVR